ncbi:MAG: hypothetical protein ACOCQV_02980, partial [Halolamina sp.]
VASLLFLLTVASLLPGLLASSLVAVSTLTTPFGALSRTAALLPGLLPVLLALCSPRLRSAPLPVRRLTAALL